MSTEARARPRPTRPPRAPRPAGRRTPRPHRPPRLAGGDRTHQRAVRTLVAASSTRRLRALLVVMVLVFGLIAVRLIDVQTVDRGGYVRLGEDQLVRTVTIPAQRGTILDRDGNELAVSVDVPTVVADPKVITAPDIDAEKLAPIVGVDAATLRARLGDRSLGFVYVARQVTPSVASRVRALNLPGISFETEPKRFYPARPLAAPLLGFVGTDDTGLAGVEAGEEAVLAGQPGREEVEQDPRGQALPNGTHQDRATRQGSDVVLTLDQSIQYEAEQALTAEVTSQHAQGGMAIVADVQTGDVLAMASVDGATPTKPAQPASATEANGPLTTVFEPGSTAKVVTIGAALEAGLVNPSTTLTVPSALTVDGTQYADVDSHPSTMTVADILRESSNVGTIEIARQLGAARFNAALHAFGFGAPTGTGFPGEASGILLPLSQYNATSMASFPIGSGIAVSAIQLLNVYMTIADGGVAHTPRLVEATVDAAGERHDLPVAASHPVLPATVASELRQMLVGVVAGGTGVEAQIPGYVVAGKTGTARKPPYTHPPYNYVADFAGFAPAGAPRLAAIVVLDAPKGQIYGGDVAAPVFSRIMQYALTVLRVPASTTPSAPATGPVP